MKRIKLFFCIILIVVLFVGCGGNKTPADTTNVIDATKSPETQLQEEPYTYTPVEFGDVDHISIGGQTFDLDYINKVLLEAINNELYFYDNNESLYLFDNSELLLRKSIEYDLYYVHSTSPWDDEHMLYVVFPNEPYPFREDKVYEVGYPITSKGMSHILSLMRGVIYDINYGSNSNDTSYQFLGRFNMKINSITQPEFDDISDNQCKAIDSGVKWFMETDNTVLELGEYEVYVRGFYQSDSSASIFFIHENGDLYSGHLWAANNVISDSDEPTIPYRVSKYEEFEAFYDEYTELIKENSVFHGIYEKTD